MSGGQKVNDEKIGNLPLLTAQRGIWIAQHLDPQSTAFNTSQYTMIDGPVDPVLIEAAARSAIAETEALRLRFEDAPEGPRQTVRTPCDAGGWSLPVVDLAAMGEPDPE